MYTPVYSRYILFVFKTPVIYIFLSSSIENLVRVENAVFLCLGSGLPGLAHLAELRQKLRIDPKIVASGPLVWELRHLQRGHFGAVHGAAGGDLINTGTYCCTLHSFGTVGTKIYRRIRTDLACVTRRILCDTHYSCTDPDPYAGRS